MIHLHFALSSSPEFGLDSGCDELPRVYYLLGSVPSSVPSHEEAFHQSRND